MGLGIYMSKMIIERHLNGTIELDRLKKGTRFTIYLNPLSNSTPPSASQHPPKSPEHVPNID